MHDFEYRNPTRVLFGRGAIDRLGEELTRLGSKKVLLVFGGGSIRNNGVYDAVTSQLSAAGVAVVEHGGVRGNPVLSHVRDGIKKARDAGVELVCGVGGGSVIDEAKAIALGAQADCDVWEFFAKRQTALAALPVAAILTLPATGSEMNGIAVVTNDETLDKMAVVLPGLLNPEFSLLDPKTTFSLSARQTAYACTDILSHLMEAYLTTSAETLLLQDPVVEGIARGVIDSTRVIAVDPSNYDARAAFMWGATLGWSGIAQLGYPSWGMPCHALEMPLSGVYDLPHGAGLSIVIPSWIRLAGEGHVSRIRLFAERILHSSSRSLDGIADDLIEFYRSIGSPTTLSEVGVIEPDVDRLSKLALSSFVARGMSNYDEKLIRSLYVSML